MDGGLGSLVKWNPVANVADTDIWNFLQTMEEPVDTLHAQGYISIGCEPCTRPVLPGQHEREGRWWWEDAKAKECGLHKGNLKEENVNGNGLVNGNGSSDIFESQNTRNLSRQHSELEPAWYQKSREDGRPKRQLEGCSLRTLVPLLTGNGSIVCGIGR